MPRILRCLLLFALAGVCLADAPVGVLTLSNGDYYTGAWQDNEASDLIRWRPNFVDEPYDFEWGAVTYATLPPPEQAAQQSGALRFDFVGGDVLFGDLIDVSPEWLTLSAALDPSAPPRRLRIARRSIRTIVRSGADGEEGGGGYLYMGPDELSAWDTSNKGDWRYALGGLGTDVKNASASRDVKLPGKTLIEVELSWKERADFSLELGVTKRRPDTASEVFEVWIQAANGDPLRVQAARPAAAHDLDKKQEQAVTDAFRIERIADHLVAIRETKHAADLAPLREVGTGAGRVQLRLYLDQTANRLIVATPTGEQLAELRVGGHNLLFGSGVRLNNRSGDIQLDRLTVSKWDGEPPTTIRGDQPRLTLKSGAVVYGDLVGYQAEERRLLVGAPQAAEGPINEPSQDESPAMGEQDAEPGAEQSENTAAETRATETKEAETKEADSGEADASETDTPETDAPIPDPESAVAETRDAGDGPAQGENDSAKQDVAPGPVAPGPVEPGRPAAIDVDEIVSLVFPNATGEETDSSQDGTVVVSLHNGLRVSGVTRGVVDHQLRIVSPNVEDELSLPLACVRMVRSVGPPLAKNAAGSKKTLPRLETDDARSVGALTGTEDKATTSCLLWRPEGSRNAAPLRDDVTGRLLFREPKPPKPSGPEQRPTRDRGVLGAIASVFTFKPAAVAGPAAPQPAVMYLRVGDKLPCKVERIDAQGVYFSSPFSSSDFAAHEHIKAIELVTDGVDGRVTSGRRDQLLTLPRVQADNPPTHLLVSTKGDYLRCRLLTLTEEDATVEIRLEETRLDRSRIARIIWLDPPADEQDPLANENAAAKTEADTHPRVQAVRRDGVRLTFNLERFTEEPEIGKGEPPEGTAKGASLVGVSQVLEACSVAVDSIDLLLLGPRIEQAAAELSYQRWKMNNAIEPRDAVDSEAGDASTNFPLVGKPAPPLGLPFFDAGEERAGDEFNIDDYQDNVLVLDFWASWCGPCMQVMPIVDKLGKEFAERGVSVVAVNMQDGAKEINAALDRLQISPRIALDRDGVAAQRYQVTGIPQTVVIGRDGRVANVFVGGGAKYEERLRAAIEAALSGEGSGE